MHDTVVAWSGF